MSKVTFTNCNGERISFDPNDTVEDLYKAGVIKIEFVEHGEESFDPRWFVADACHPSPNEKGQR